MTSSVQISKSGLRILNSLDHHADKTKNKKFVPASWDNKTVTWYTCGPTVYNSSHIGHARNYVTFDVIRRILEDYFGFTIFQVMNITDVDDKIILKAYQETNGKSCPIDQVSRRYETEFFEDLSSLNVRFPSVITRVSEYVGNLPTDTQGVVPFIQKLINNGYAYPSNGDVYFDVPAYQSAESQGEKQFQYPILDPISVDSEEKMSESEGFLSTNQIKKNKRDFVLWKGKKYIKLKNPDGTTVETNIFEPSWPATFFVDGKPQELPGRPGWHIECSAMCEAIFGDTLDIHCGGEDLKFPHHDNEIAQCQAHSGHKWVDFFLHCGHLRVVVEELDENGNKVSVEQKMSKSLKNFTTIREALANYTPRVLRLFFIGQRWSATFTKTDNSLPVAKDLDNRFQVFFQKIASFNVKANEMVVQKPTKQHLDLLKSLDKAKSTVDAAFKDSFDTPLVVQTLAALLKQANSFMNTPNFSYFPLIQVSDFFNRIFGCMGCDYSVSSQGSGQMLYQNLANTVAQFRQSIRTTSIQSKKSLKQADSDPIQPFNNILDLCDKLRDQDLVSCGIDLEDVSNGFNLVYDTPAKIAEKRRIAHEETQKAKASHAKAKAAQKSNQKNSKKSKASKKSTFPIDAKLFWTSFVWNNDPKKPQYVVPQGSIQDDWVPSSQYDKTTGEITPLQHIPSTLLQKARTNAGRFKKYQKRLALLGKGDALNKT